MSRIIIVGGHGKIALLLAPLLVADGHEVTSLIRNIDHSTEVALAGANPVLADIEQLDSEAIARHLSGHDVVIWSAGAGGGDPARSYAVDRDGAIRSMDATRVAEINRYIMVSYRGSRTDHGVPEDSSFYAYAEAKSAADNYLRGTDLDWTILGPSRLVDESGTGAIDVGSAQVDGTVPRADVAAVIAATVATPQTIRRMIGFDSGSVPIAEALVAGSRDDHR